MIRIGYTIFALVLTIPFTASGSTTQIKVGSTSIAVNISRTAHLFHVVDNLSLWSYYCHPEYRDGMGSLSKQDLEVLDSHKAIRVKRGWSNGFEKAFYTSLSLEQSLDLAIEKQFLTQQEVMIERRVFLQFSDRIDLLLDTHEERLKKFANRLEAETQKIAEFAESFERFTGSSPEYIPVFLLVTPHPYNFGGGYNGNRLTVEIPEEADPFPIFLHELIHAFIEPIKSKLKEKVSGVEGLDAHTLNEGIAYALSPGLVHAESDTADPLLSRVTEDIARGKDFSDPHTRFHRYALVLRPLLRQSLYDKETTIDDFLPEAVQAWKKLHEGDLAENNVQSL